MNIEITEDHWYRLKIPAKIQYNFWDFLHMPKCKMGEVINFIQEGKVVAATIASAVPKQLCRCKSGKIKFRISWRNSDFKDLR